MTFRSLARRVVVVFCVVFLPAVAWAQSETGNIAGVVRDASGAVLPGVTVEAASPALIEKVRIRRHGRPGPLPHRRSAAWRVHRHLHVARLQHVQARRDRVDDGVHGDRECRDESGSARGDDHGHRGGSGGGHLRTSSSRPRSRATCSMRSRPADVPRSSSRSSWGPTAEPTPRPSTMSAVLGATAHFSGSTASAPTT